MSYMYILECSDGSYYTGSTKDLDRRLWEHQNGLGANHTAKRLPVKLVYCEECDRIDDAFYREKQVQGWSHKKKEALMASDTNQLHRLAVCRNESHSENVGFDSAQPTCSGLDSMQVTVNLARSLSGVEGNTAADCAGFDSGFGSAHPTAQPTVLPSDNLARSLSGVETSNKGMVE